MLLGTTSHTHRGLRNISCTSTATPISNPFSTHSMPRGHHPYMVLIHGLNLRALDSYPLRLLHQINTIEWRRYSEGSTPSGLNSFQNFWVAPAQNQPLFFSAEGYTLYVEESNTNLFRGGQESPEAIASSSIFQHVPFLCRKTCPKSRVQIIEMSFLRYIPLKGWHQKEAQTGGGHFVIAMEGRVDFRLKNREMGGKTWSSPHMNDWYHEHWNKPSFHLLKFSSL